LKTLVSLLSVFGERCALIADMDERGPTKEQSLQATVRERNPMRIQSGVALRLPPHSKVGFVLLEIVDRKEEIQSGDDTTTGAATRTTRKTLISSRQRARTVPSKMAR
jgi:hypothetical protein